MYDEGSKEQIAILLWPGVLGKLVHVTGRTETLDWGAVSAALDTDRFFVAGEADTPGTASRRAITSKLCWHIAAIHNRCRPMAAQEVPCEQMGSHMSKVWGLIGKKQWLNPQDFMDSVSVQEAKISCLGSKRDEQIVAFVVDCLYAAGCRPIIEKRAQRYRRVQGVDPSASLPIANFVAKRNADADQDLPSSLFNTLKKTRNGASDSDGDVTLTSAKEALHTVGLQSGGCNREQRRALKQRGLPQTNLPDVFLATHVQPHRVEALPLHVEDKRTTAKDRANSTVRDARKHWLNSEAGLAWMREGQDRWKVRELRPSHSDNDGDDEG
jgi:hypothetical protein